MLLQTLLPPAPLLLLLALLLLLLLRLLLLSRVLKLMPLVLGLMLVLQASESHQPLFQAARVLIFLSRESRPGLQRSVTCGGGMPAPAVAGVPGELRQKLRPLAVGQALGFGMTVDSISQVVRS